MNIRPCCCLKPRAGAIVVGILEMIIAVAGTAAYIYLKFIMEPYTDGKSESTEDANSTVTTTTTTTTPAPEGDNSSTVVIDHGDHPYYVHDIPLMAEIYGVFVLLTYISVIFISCAVIKKSSMAAKGAFYFTLILTVLYLITSVGYFIRGYHWHLLLPIQPVFLLEVYFCWALYDYTKYFNYSQPLAKPRA